VKIRKFLSIANPQEINVGARLYIMYDLLPVLLKLGAGGTACIPYAADPAGALIL
jgi:hypothetical protein